MKKLIKLFLLISVLISTSGLIGCRSVVNKSAFCKLQLDYTDEALQEVNATNRTQIKSQYDFCN